jgi:uncharacterized protein (DUF58 family)
MSTHGAYADLDVLVRLQSEARGFSFLPRQPIRSTLAGRHASRLRGRGLNFEELRRYLPGDDVRNIDWKVTARMRKPYVRVYTEERDRPALLLVDQRGSMFFGSRRAMKSVVAAEAAALAAWRILDVGDRVGGLIFDDHDVTEIRPHRSRERVMRLLRAVVDKNQGLSAETTLEPNARQLNAVLERAVRTAKHDHLIVLISDLLGADVETERLFTLLTQHNDVVLIFTYDQLEARVPDSGRVVVGKGELQLEIDTSSARLRKSFEEGWQERLEAIRSIARKCGVPMLAVEPGESVGAQVRRQLGGLA